MTTANKVLVICSGLYTPGGIERATVNLVNLLSSNQYNVTLLILDKSVESFYNISSRVKVVNLNLHFGITEHGNPFTRKLQFLLHTVELRKMLKKMGATTIISTDYSYTIATYLTKIKNVKLFSWEHHHFYWIRRNYFWKMLFKIIYPKVNGIICLNKAEAEFFRAIGCKTFVIPNFISSKELYSDLSSKTILTIGWLIKRKGIDLVPEIAKLVKIEHPDWKWKIIGKGELGDYLKAKIKERDLEDFITVIEPLSPNLENTYLNTSIYVMLSRFECFPMVLLEAQSYGIPCVAFNCPTGPFDIINNGIDGHLIQPEDIKTIAGTICNLIANNEKLKKMGVNARHNAERFAPEKILPFWQKLIEAN